MSNDFMSTQLSAPERATYNPDGAHGCLILKSHFAMLVSSALCIIDRHLSATADHSATLSDVASLHADLEQER
jgi:hypothetical protein